MNARKIWVIDMRELITPPAIRQYLDFVIENPMPPCYSPAAMVWLASLYNERGRNAVLLN
jgi:hypothetical protein